MSCKAVLNQHVNQLGACLRSVKRMQPQLMLMHAELPQALWHSDLQEAS